MKKKSLSIFFYIIAMLIILFYFFIELQPRILLSEIARLVLLGGSCICAFIGGIFWSKHKNNNKAMKINLWIFFVLYLVLLITLTMFDPMWGRNAGGLLGWTKDKFNIYIENSMNLIPFKTIIEYAQKMFSSLLDRRTIFLNLFGNIVCLMPLAFFIPMLFKKINNTKKFLLSILCFSLGIEIIQFITCVGSCDIDDIILNSFGALIAYKILNVKDINYLIRNIFLLEKNKVSKKKVLVVVIPIIIVSILLLGLYKVSQDNYNQNLDEHIAKLNYKLEIVDESEPSDTALEKFYEDEYHIYYFNSIKSNEVYAIINENEKYLVKDLLNNNPTKYKVTISKLEDSGLKFITKNKYEEIVLKGNGELSPKISIDDDTIIEIGYGKSNSNIDVSNPENSYYEMQFFIVPLKSGNTEFEIKLIDNNNDNATVSIEKYKVRVDNNLKVDYEKIN